MKCIICRENKEKFTDEHVIPDSLGGYYHTYNVCVDCNSSMGKKVDAPLVNHKLSELYRFAQDIAGKTGKVPNPFAGTFTKSSDPSKKARMDVGGDGKLEVYQTPEITWIEDNGKIVSLRIAVDSKDESRIEQIAAKALARKDIPPEAVVRGERTVEIDTGPFTGRWAIDINNFKIGLLKIAYEFAVDTIPEYFEDEEAVRISEVLRGAKYDEVLKYVTIGNGLQHQIWEPFSQFLDFDSRSHYLALSANDSMGLVCLVKLHDLFSVGVVLSSKRYLGEGGMHVGINSLEMRNFVKLTGVEMINRCLGPRHCRPLYYLESETREKAEREISSPNFRYEGQENEDIPLYDNQGELICYLKDVLEHAQVETKHNESHFVNVYWFNPAVEYCVKSVGAGKLYRIIAYEMEQEKLRKL
ncbi:HNH endonuclease [Pseudomonas chlororaphis]|uniref:HNH endonuclease n=1 Tax=Pseudomonas chlororaphis TaxID=587753 RepID=UPI000B1B1FD4|nr:HNH endonuclease [Pseudomonas chlororaphis]